MMSFLIKVQLADLILRAEHSARSEFSIQNDWGINFYFSRYQGMLSSSIIKWSAPFDSPLRQEFIFAQFRSYQGIWNFSFLF